MPASLPSRWLTLVDGSELPTYFVYKLCYQVEGHTSEGTLLSGSRGQFGVIDVIGIHTSTSEEPFGSTAYHVRDATFWEIPKGSTEGVPEIRCLQCTAMTPEGLPLLDISDEQMGIPAPTELLETILHA